MNIDKINNNDNIKSDINQNIQNSKNIENSQKLRIKNGNKSNHIQISSEIRDIGNNIEKIILNYKIIFIKRTIIYYKIMPKISYIFIEISSQKYKKRRIYNRNFSYITWVSKEIYHIYIYK